jgi:hypothetical protein
MLAEASLCVKEDTGNAVHPETRWGPEIGGNVEQRAKERMQLCYKGHLTDLQMRHTLFFLPQEGGDTAD